MVVHDYKYRCECAHGCDCFQLLEHMVCYSCFRLRLSTTVLSQHKLLDKFPWVCNFIVFSVCVIMHSTSYAYCMHWLLYLLCPLPHLSLSPPSLPPLSLPLSLSLPPPLSLQLSLPLSLSPLLPQYCSFSTAVVWCLLLSLRVFSSAQSDKQVRKNNKAVDWIGNGRQYHLSPPCSQYWYGCVRCWATRH